MRIAIKNKGPEGDEWSDKEEKNRLVKGAPRFINPVSLLL